MDKVRENIYKTKKARLPITTHAGANNVWQKKKAEKK